MAELTLLEKGVALFNAEWSFRNAIARTFCDRIHEFSYDAAEPGRLRGSSGKKGKNAAAESWRINRNRYDLMWDARDMEKNFAFVAGALDRMEEYTCGQIAYESRTGDEDIDKVYEDYFHDWCQRADITGRHRLRELVAMAYRGWKRDGEHGFIILDDGEEIRIQAIEGDRIGSPDKIEQREDNIGGIKINELGQITGYEIYNCSRMSNYTFDQEVAPERFIHLFKPRRPSQYHGITAFATALPHARDIHEVLGLEKQAMKFASMFAGFIRRKDGIGGANWLTTKGPINGNPNSFLAQAGMIRRLAEGEEIQFPPGAVRPSGNVLQLIQLLRQEMAQGMNLPYGFLFDMADLGGVTARVEVFLAMRTIRQDQNRLKEVVLDRVRDEVLENGIAWGHIPSHPNFKQGKWNFGARITGDTGHDTQAKIAKLLQGLGTASAIIEEDDGGNVEEVFRQIAREVNLARTVATETGVPIEMISQRWPQATPMLAAMATPPAPPLPAPKGLVGLQGEKSVGPLLEVIEKVSTGMMEHEVGVSTLIVMYGMSRQQAEKIVPKTVTKSETIEPEKDQ